MSYRLPVLKIISGVTNIITAVKVFSMPRTIFKKKKNVDFASPSLLALMISWLSNGSRYKQSDHCGHYGVLSYGVMKWNIRGAKPLGRAPQVRAQAR